MSGDLSVPAGDPAVLESLADQLDTAASGIDGLASRSVRVTADIKTDADWTGSAADGYTAFTGNLSQGVGSTQAPLCRIASAVRGYAGYLRTAQEKAAAYSSAAQTAQASQHPAHLAAANTARQDAVSAIADEQAAGDHAAAEVNAAADDAENPFGPDGVVRKWIETIHAPWDVLAGDAAVARALALVEQGKETVETAEKFQKGLAELLQQNAREMNAYLDAVDADPMTQADEILRLLTDTQAAAKWNKGLLEAGETLTKGAPLWKSVAVGSDVLGMAGDAYTIVKPEDAGTMGWVDRGVAAANFGLSGADLLGVVGVTAEIPVVGQVALIGTGVYLGGDFLYHHWTPFRNVCNDVGHTTASIAKDAWHALF